MGFGERVGRRVCCGIEDLIVADKYCKYFISTARQYLETSKDASDLQLLMKLYCAIALLFKKFPATFRWLVVFLTTFLLGLDLTGQFPWEATVLIRLKEQQICSALWREGMTLTLFCPKFLYSCSKPSGPGQAGGGGLGAPPAGPSRVGAAASPVPAVLPLRLRTAALSEPGKNLRTLQGEFLY